MSTPAKHDYSKLDPGFLGFLRDFYAQGGMPFALDTLPEARAAMNEFPDMLDAPAVDVGSVRDLHVEGAASLIPARLYVPKGKEAETDNIGMVFFHGGGWIMGGLDSHDRLCRRLCQSGQITVLAVDYRLAPENPFPAGVDDAQAAFHWACEHADEIGVDPNCLAVAGDSAGGNISASLALTLRGHARGEPAFQLLIYPATDLVEHFSSYDRCGEGYMLDKPDMDFFTALYVGDSTDGSDIRVSPLKCKDLSGAASTYLVTAGHDPLFDQGELYAAALSKAGVAVTYCAYPSMIHGFFSMSNISKDVVIAIEAAGQFVGDYLRVKKEN